MTEKQLQQKVDKQQKEIEKLQKSVVVLQQALKKMQSTIAQTNERGRRTDTTVERLTNIIRKM